MESQIAKEQELQAIFNELIQKYNLKIEIDPKEYDIQSPCSVDVEHDEQGNLVGIGVYDGIRCLYFTGVNDNLSSNLCKLSLIAHNGNGDLELLNQWGIPVKKEQLVWDTMLFAHIQDSSRKGYGLKQLVKEDLGIEYPSYEDIVGKRTAKQKNPRVTLDKWPVDLVAKYNAFDCFCTYKLYVKQKVHCPDYEK